jgi:hypothetical protein
MNLNLKVKQNRIKDDGYLKAEPEVDFNVKKR